MVPTGAKPAEVETQREKLANSYNALLEEFSAAELHTVGNYQVGRLIGKGSFGKVYLASNKLIRGSKVVLKSANKDDANLAREVHIHRQLIHPHIARLYEVIVTENHVWLVLEYCPGDELYNYVIQHGALSPSMVQKIFAQVIGAVSYVHNKSYVHRDLKLENILLDKNENVKLVDFGFTREYSGKANYLQTWCGTVCYAAPEMLKGEKYAAEKVDVWSLGVILYAMLCGELPFDEDDESATKMKILKEEPSYPEHMPEPAKELIKLCLSKRPILRPSLADILAHPWLSEHTPQQQAILKIQQIPPFTTQLEKDALMRLRNAGVDIDKVIEQVLSQRCDALAGWWALLIEKEERKVKRREEKRREKDFDAKALRRISAASARLALIAPTIKESDEENAPSPKHPPRVENGERGRTSSNLEAMEESAAESSTTPAKKDDTPLKVNTDTTTTKPAKSKMDPLPPTPTTPKPIDKGPQRATTEPPQQQQQRQTQVARPQNPRRRSSGLQMMTNNPDLLSPETLQPKRRRRYPQPFFNQLVSFKHWIVESTKRNKTSAPNKTGDGLLTPNRAATDRHDLRRTSSDVPHLTPTPPRRPNLQSSRSHPSAARLSTHGSQGSMQRYAHSPSPLTPSSSKRRSRGASGLRSRKSTSSSISSIHTIHAHAKTHSMASSTSSTSLVSPSVSVKSQSQSQSNSKRRSSPGVPAQKPLPGPPSAGGFSSNVRVVQTPPSLSVANTSSASGSAFTGVGPPSPGLVFAKRKRSPFKGPTLLAPGQSALRRRSEGTPTRTGSLGSRKSAGMIQEEDEEEDIEEVDVFTPEDGAAEEEERDAALDAAIQKQRSLSVGDAHAIARTSGSGYASGSDRARIGSGHSGTDADEVTAGGLSRMASLSPDAPAESTAAHSDDNAISPRALPGPATTTTTTSGNTSASATAFGSGNDKMAPEDSGPGVSSRPSTARGSSRGTTHARSSVDTAERAATDAAAAAYAYQ